MSTLNDEILRATGGPTINDGLSTFFSRTATESLQDAEQRFLLATVIAAEGNAIADLWHQVNLEQALSPSNQLNDIKLAFWTSK